MPGPAVPDDYDYHRSLLGQEMLGKLLELGPEGNMVARVDPRSTSHTGDTVKVAFETNRLHFFDKETEKSILRRQ